MFNDQPQGVHNLIMEMENNFKCTNNLIYFDGCLWKYIE